MSNGTSSDPQFWNQLREHLAASDYKSAQAQLQEENDRLETIDEIKNYSDVNVALQMVGHLAEYDGQMDGVEAAVTAVARGAYERNANPQREASGAELAADKAGKLAVALGDDKAERPCSVCASDGQKSCPAHALLDEPIALQPTAKALELTAEPASAAEQQAAGLAASEDDFGSSAFNGGHVEQPPTVAVAPVPIAPAAPLWGCDHQAAAPEKCARGCNG